MPPPPKQEDGAPLARLVQAASQQQQSQQQPQPPPPPPLQGVQEAGSPGHAPGRPGAQQTSPVMAPRQAAPGQPPQTVWQSGDGLANMISRQVQQQPGKQTAPPSPVLAASAQPPIAPQPPPGLPGKGAGGDALAGPPPGMSLAQLSTRVGPADFSGDRGSSKMFPPNFMPGGKLPAVAAPGGGAKMPEPPAPAAAAEADGKAAAAGPSPADHLSYLVPQLSLDAASVARAAAAELGLAAPLPSVASAQALQILEACHSRAMPQPSDSDWKRYKPRHPVANVPATFPRHPPDVIDAPGLFRKMDPEALFFAFYYQPDSYQQYLAAQVRRVYCSLSSWQLFVTATMLHSA